ncbi:MAG: hypothetical protein ACI3VA_06540 [Candidatus Limivicinus sp.]
MEQYLPYIVTVLCSVISGIASYSASRRQAKADLEKLQKQHELDIEKEREKFAMEKERMELEHKHQLELKQKEMENQLGTDVMSTLVKEYVRSPAGQAQMRSTANKKRK